ADRSGIQWLSLGQRGAGPQAFARDLRAAHQDASTDYRQRDGFSRADLAGRRVVHHAQEAQARSRVGALPARRARAVAFGRTQTSRRAIESHRGLVGKVSQAGRDRDRATVNKEISVMMTRPFASEASQERSTLERRAACHASSALIP